MKRALLFLEAMMSLGCGAHRPPLPPPLHPLATHQPLPPEPQPSTAPLTLTLPETESFTLPSGVEVQVVTRPQALVGHVALLAAGGWLGDGGRVEDDVVLNDLLHTTLNMSSRIDERGLRLHRSEVATNALPRAIQLLEALRTLRFTRAQVTHAAGARTEERALYRRAWIHSVHFDLIRRLYGPDSPHAVWNNPMRRLEVVQHARLNARLQQIVAPRHLTLVIVSSYDAEFVRAALLAATASWPAGEHGRRRRLTAPAFHREVNQQHSAPAHPQAIGYSSSSEMGHITLMEGGPSAFAADHAAYRVAVRVLGGMYSSRPNAVFREERRESYGAQSRIRAHAGYSLMSFYMSVRPDQLGDALRILTGELSRVGHVESLSEDEVERARRIELATEASRFDNAESIAKSILTARAEGQTLDAYVQRFAAMQRVSRADVALAGLAWMRPTDAPIAVVANGYWIATHDLSVPGGYERAR